MFKNFFGYNLFLMNKKMSTFSTELESAQNAAF